MSLRSIFGKSGNKELSPQEKWNALQKQQAKMRGLLFTAIRKEDTTTIDQILADYPEAKNWKDKEGDKGRPLLHYALQKNCLKSFTHLLDAGINPDQTYLTYEVVERVFFIPIDRNKYSFRVLDAACLKQKKDFVFACLQRMDKISVDSYAREKKHSDIDYYLANAKQIRADYLAAPKEETAQETKPVKPGKPAATLSVQAPGPLERLMQEFNKLQEKQAVTEKRLEAAEKELNELKDPGVIVKIPNLRAG